MTRDPTHMQAHIFQDGRFLGLFYTITLIGSERRGLTFVTAIPEETLEHRGRHHGCHRHSDSSISDLADNIFCPYNTRIKYVMPRGGLHDDKGEECGC